MVSLRMNTLHRRRKIVRQFCDTDVDFSVVKRSLIVFTVPWANLEALDISQIDHPDGKQALAAQVLEFIDTNGTLTHSVPRLWISRLTLPIYYRLFLCQRARAHGRADHSSICYCSSILSASPRGKRKVPLQYSCW